MSNEGGTMKKLGIPPYCLLAATLVAFAMASCVTTETTEQASITKAEPSKPPPLTEAELRVLRKMGGRVLEDGNIAIGKVKIDRVAKELSFPAKINMDQGPIEVLICTPRGRKHESLLVSEADPLNIQLALILSGASNGARKPPPEKGAGPPMGDLFDVYIVNDKGKKIPVEHYLVDLKKSSSPERNGWVFVGSKFTSNGKCLASREGNIVVTWSNGNTIFDNPGPNGDVDDDININGKLRLKTGTEVTVILHKRE